MAGIAAVAELEQLRLQVERLREQLGEEQLLRSQAEEAVEAVAVDRNRLQRARDELAVALLAAERRALEAEEDQLRAETAAAALTQQLRDAQREAAPPAVGAAGASTHLESRGRPVRASTDGDGYARDAEILLAELDSERQRSEELVRTLEAAEREAVSATEKLLKAQQRIKQLEGKGGSKDGRDSREAGRESSASGGSGSNVGAGPRGAGGFQELASLDGVATSGGGDVGAAAAVAALHQRIAALKASRDKLIGAFDAQAAEVERLSTDNAALAEVAAQLRDVSTKWEAQAQDSLAQNERLKDLLEESATWSMPGAAPAGNSTAPGSSSTAAGTNDLSSGAAAGVAAAAAALAAHAAAGPGGDAAAEGGFDEVAAVGGDSSALAALCQRFERELLLEKARSAQLDLQVRALCMELTRAAQSSSQMQAALVPMLGGIEARLVQVLGMRPRPGALTTSSS